MTPYDLSPDAIVTKATELVARYESAPAAENHARLYASWHPRGSNDNLYWLMIAESIRDAHGPTYTLDGYPVDLSAFLSLNADLEPELVRAIGRMSPRDEMTFAGGEGAVFLLRRVS